MVPNGDGGFVLQWRPVDECPVIVRQSTGERGRLIRAITNKITELPRFGKVTITVEEAIKLDNSEKIYNKWNEEDWVVVE